MDIPSLGVDYYTGNLHKWCYVPPAVAFLWVASNDHLQAMHYPIISHAYNQGLLEESGFVGDRKKEPRAPGQDRSGARVRVTVDEALNSPSSVGV